MNHLRCEVCGQTATDLTWDRAEIEPTQNFLNIWVRQFSPIEPGYRRCKAHRQEPTTRLRFETEEDWERWKSQNQ